MRPGPRWLLVLILGLAAAGIVVVATQPRQARLGSDFAVDYSAGVLLREGRPAAIYDQALLTSALHQAAPDSRIDRRLPFNLPLAAALPDALLSLLPMDAAFRVWEVTSLALILGTVFLLQRSLPLDRRALLLGSAGMMAAVPTWATLTEGQPDALVLLGAALLVRCAFGDADQHKRWSRIATAAGAGALIAVKPQYLPAFLLILVAVRQWLPLLSALLAAAAVAISPLIGGASALAAMVHNALLANALVSIRANESWMGLLSSLMPSTAAMVVAFLLYLGVLGWLGWTAWQRMLDPPAFAMVAGAVALLSSPHALPQDALVLAIPAWLSVALYRERAVQVVSAWLAVDLALLFDMRGLWFPLMPLVLTVLLAWSCWRFRRQAPTRQRPPLALAG